MENNVAEYEFPDRRGRSIQLWAVHVNERLISISFAVFPYWQLENIDFPVDRWWL